MEPEDVLRDYRIIFLQKTLWKNDLQNNEEHLNNHKECVLKPMKLPLYNWNV